MANKFKGVKCPKCGKKGLSYAPHPHALGFKDYDRVACRWCNARFSAEKMEAHLTQRPPDAEKVTAGKGVLPSRKARRLSNERG